MDSPISMARIIYPDITDRDFKFGAVSDYQPMLDSFGNIIIQVDDEDYSGDSRVIYRFEDKYGFLHFGWGSCSGCDALQACDSYEDIDKLIEDLRRSIIWFESVEELKKYFSEKDWELDCTYHVDIDKQKEFIDKVLNL